VRSAEHVGREAHRDGVVAEAQCITTDETLEKDTEPEAIEIAESNVALESLPPNAQCATVSLIQG
jgi:hypothetical protein